jgi:hypothetical protein
MLVYAIFRLLSDDMLFKMGNVDKKHVDHQQLKA